MAERETVKRSVIRYDSDDDQTNLSLSDELVEEIMIWLPTNTLFRCKCVCKRWQALISASSLVERVKSLPTLTTGFFLCVDLPDVLTKPEVYFYQTDPKVIQLESSLSFLHKSVVPVASHEGFLLCVERPDSGIFSVIDSFSYILCNPYPKQWVTLPKPRSDHRIKFVTLYCYKKEGSNADTFEFKVVSLIDVFCHNVIELEIYSSDTGQWEELTFFHHLGFLRPSCPIVLLDGAIHFWNPDNRCLCVYNLKEESIRFMELPVGSFDSCAMGMGHLGVSAESLYYSEGSKNHFRVWVLDGAQWFLKHSIDFESLVDELEETFESDYLFYPVAFHPLNDNIVLARLIHSPKVVLYHMDTTRIEVVKNIDSSLYFPVIPYALSAWHPFVKHH
ncbi:hypothetical protein ACHQM5_015088 [Ranunculus cassubicifolius]